MNKIFNNYKNNKISYRFNIKIMKNNKILILKNIKFNQNNKQNITNKMINF